MIASLFLLFFGQVNASAPAASLTSTTAGTYATPTGGASAPSASLSLIPSISAGSATGTATAPATALTLAASLTASSAYSGGAAPSAALSTVLAIASSPASGAAQAPGTSLALTASFGSSSATGNASAPAASLTETVNMVAAPATGGALASTTTLTFATGLSASSPTGTAVAPATALTLTASAAFSPATAPVIVKAPISRDEAKAFLKVAFTDDDILIDNLIDAANDYIEDTTGIVTAPRSRVFPFDAFGDRLPLLRFPIRGVTSVSYIDTAGSPQTLASNQWRVSTRANVTGVQRANAVTWPATDTVDGAVTVTADIGYLSNAVVPALVRVAAYKLVSAWYQVRDVGEVPTDVDKILSAAKSALL